MKYTYLESSEPINGFYRSSCSTYACQLLYLSTKYSGEKATPCGCVSMNIWSWTTLPYLCLRVIAPTNTKITLQPV